MAGGGAVRRRIAWTVTWIKRLIRQRWSEWQGMQHYVDTDGCRMVFLTDALGDVSPQACGKCDACPGEPVVASSLEDSQILAAEHFLRQSAVPLCCPVQVPGDAFRVYGFTGRLPRELQAEKGRALCWRHDEKWGRAVTEDMRRGRFGRNWCRRWPSWCAIAGNPSRGPNGSPACRRTTTRT